MSLVELFNEAEEDFPDKSTGFLLEITAERARQAGWKSCDCSDVADALVNEHDMKD